MYLIYVSMYGYFSLHKVIIWSLKNQSFWTLMIFYRPESLPGVLKFCSFDPGL